ncbi:hypothetical protein FEZ18_04470 [Oceanihabitans sp. IOP_32]|uniref:beta strand repeat-containing protein n=1 Tax=Oceanihabitans sp. IOP_32 TaxID=2529032 RepID=UPI0012935203|nr:hypothetical protein [Oceanihabitans sp. IOP_32]QFZ54113.1 hypothetical protein FEZ18_04470 [Oceanihabitans sp. IOP_32]
MKKITLIVLTLFTFLASSKAIAQQGFGTNQPDRSAAVDIVSSKRGLLIPRLSLTSTTVAAPVNSPAESLLVYNTATTGDVTPGYYYWDADPTNAKWVRFVSATTEKTVTVSAGKNVTVSSSTTGNTTDYEVAVAGGTDGQVLVTRIVGGVTTTVWVDPATFINGVVTASNGLNINASNDIKLGGTLTEATTTIATGTNDLAITGLEDVSTTFDSTTQNIVVMGTDGVLKLTSAQSLVNDAIDEGNLTAKTLSGNGITVTAGNTVGTDVSVASSLLKDVTLGIADNAITTDKILDGTIGTVDLADGAVTNTKITGGGAGEIMISDASGNVTWVNPNTLLASISDGNTTVVSGTGTTTDPYIVEVKDGSINTIHLTNGAVTNAKVGADAITTDKILDGTIGTVDLADGAVTNTKITGGGSGEIMISDASGNVTWVNPNTLLASISDGNTTVVSGTGTTTDPYIVEVKDGSINTIHLTNGAVTNAKVGADAITTDKILDGTIGTVDLADGAVTNTKITGGGSGEIMISDASGNVTWVNPNTLLASISDGNTTVVSGTGTTTDPYIVEVKDGSINTIHLTNGAVTNAKVGADAITTDKILDGTIGTVDLADGAVTNAKITGGGAGEIMISDASGNVTWVNPNTLLASISDGNTTVVSGTGTTTDPYIVEVKDGSINTIHLTNGAVTNAKVGADAITTDKILDGTILSDDIANKTIQVSDIADAGNNQVLVTGATGEAAWIDQSNLGNTTTADNGLTKTGNNVQLGGALITPTVITADATNTLAIAGLQNSAANSAAIVLADENTGILRKVARSLEYTTGADFTVASQTGYNKFVQEITILANIGSDDIDITLPPAADAKGQVINVKIANTNEPDAYVNIPGVDGVTIYGSMPYQGWIIKSNGSTWSLVGRI